jgi:hypothetical protein
MQEPDIQPGEYYVSVIDGKKSALLLGPFTNDHAAALAAVDKVRAKAIQIDSKASFYAFGTARLPADDSIPIRTGSLNKYFPEIKF